jgi:hypothetical protein
MSRKLNSLSALFAFTVLAIAASSAMAQIGRVRSDSVKDGIKAPTALGCCKCLGGTNTLDLSSVSSNNWRVNNSPVAFPSAINSYWNLNPAPAQWVSPLANGSTNAVPPGTYDYKLDFVVPNCSIGQKVTLSGRYGGDDNIYVYLDNIASANLISQCTGGWCFNTQNPPPQFPNYPVVTPGIHTLIVRVVNGGGPSGMFINARLTGTCSSQLTTADTRNPKN